MRLTPVGNLGVRCERCNVEIMVDLSKLKTHGRDDDAIVRALHRKGWTGSLHQITCPACTKKLRRNVTAQLKRPRQRAITHD